MKDAPLTPDQRSLAESHVDLVAGTVATFRGTVSEEVIVNADLVGIGHAALIEAAQRFDPERGRRFRPYASETISRRVMDHLRRFGVRHKIAPTHAWEPEDLALLRDPREDGLETELHKKQLLSSVRNGADGALDPLERTILSKVVFRNWSLAQVARYIGADKRTTVSKRIAAAISSLREWNNRRAKPQRRRP
jgi:RNA polymerase sigma factor (sigma-70 family)